LHQQYANSSRSAALLGCIHCGRNNAQLRIINSGSAALQDVIIVFPNDEVKFGDIPAQSASRYVAVKHGVGPYAAFRFIWNGVEVRQNVMDFIGWKPISGQAFTYRVQLEPRASQPFLRVTKVEKDR
jgi:hypothetical protein